MNHEISWRYDPDETWRNKIFGEIQPTVFCPLQRLLLVPLHLQAKRWQRSGWWMRIHMDKHVENMRNREFNWSKSENFWDIWSSLHLFHLESQEETVRIPVFIENNYKHSGVLNWQRNPQMNRIIGSWFESNLFYRNSLGMDIGNHSMTPKKVAQVLTAQIAKLLMLTLKGLTLN